MRHPSKKQKKCENVSFYNLWIPFDWSLNFKAIEFKNVFPICIKWLMIVINEQRKTQGVSQKNCFKCDYLTKEIDGL